MVLVVSPSLPDHKSLDEDVNEYLSFRSFQAPFCHSLAVGLAVFLSFETRSGSSAGSIGEVLSVFNSTSRDAACSSNRVFLETKMTKP